MRHGSLAATALLTALVSASPFAHAVEVRGALDRDVPRLLKEKGVPSVSIAQIEGGRIVLTAAYGEQSAGVPATPRSLYNIASLTKPLTAEVILRLASRQRLGLDDAMYRFWTDPDIAGDDRRTLLTPRIALGHQTGFPNWRDKKTGLSFLFTPGTKIRYSGEGYNYAARFAEKKASQPFEDLAQTLLFDPMGMKSTSYVGRNWFEGRIAVPVDAKGAALEPGIAKHFNAADLVYTTAGDYAAFMLGVLKDEGLAPEIAKERNRIQADDTVESCSGTKAATCPLRTGFGLGWEIYVFKDETVMMHTGKDDGLFTFAYLSKTTGDGAVILTNGENGAYVVLPVLELLGASPQYVAYLKSQGG